MNDSPLLLGNEQNPAYEGLSYTHKHKKLGISVFKHIGNEQARSKSRQKITDVLSDPVKSALFFAKNPYAKAFYQERDSADPKVFNLSLIHISEPTRPY